MLNNDDFLRDPEIVLFNWCEQEQGSYLFIQRANSDRWRKGHNVKDAERMVQISSWTQHCKACLFLKQTPYFSTEQITA
ncbi:hypothetical protein HNY73_011882 [Argiope bruennichi]|uniref:Uncharacterized protein n=1 Tax=Argiope bruennichi TaxID=94029 RepID=A0A8T0ETD6_ARGBR|nr:hypothetical protein HNY73_011882 [Argiope bruennichi]